MGAGEGFLSCVQSHVDLDVVVPAETLAADLALEGFLSSVGPLVVSQNVLVAKTAVAGLAGESAVAICFPVFN